MQLLFLVEAVMPRYRLSGQYDFAPDRGSPNGNREPFTHEFDADTDELAKKHVAEWRENKVDIVDESFEHIDESEKTTPIELQ